MRICVIGAGAIGGLLAIKLAQAGHIVSVVARGSNLLAIQNNGFKLITEDGTASTLHLRATQTIGDLGTQDLVILGMKAHQVAAVVRDLESLYHENTMVLTAQNGIPWWYFYKHGGQYDGQCLESVDPGGEIAKYLPIDRVVGTVVYPAAELIAQGLFSILKVIASLLQKSIIVSPQEFNSYLRRSKRLVLKHLLFQISDQKFGRNFGVI